MSRRRTARAPHGLVSWARHFLAGCLGLALVGSALASCSSGAGAFSGPPPQRRGPAVTYVSVSEQQLADSGDVRTSWPQQFYRSALPSWATADELDLPSNWELHEAPVIAEVLALRPTVVTVAVGLQDAGSGEGVPEFSAALRGLLAALRSARVPTVLVANVVSVPSLQLPGSDLTSLIAAYNRTIASVSHAEGAVLVDAQAAFGRALRAGRAVMGYGNALTPLGENLMAHTFEIAATHRPLWRQAAKGS